MSIENSTFVFREESKSGALMAGVDQKQRKISSYVCAARRVSYGRWPSNAVKQRRAEMLIWPLRRKEIWVEVITVSVLKRTPHSSKEKWTDVTVFSLPGSENYLLHAYFV